MRPSVGEPLRMRLVGGVKDNLSGDFDALTVASVTVGGGKHPNARMMMLVDVPIEELFAVCGHLVLNAASAWGLSLDTRGRDNERRTPRVSYRSVRVPEVIWAPQSEWMISW